MARFGIAVLSDGREGEYLTDRLTDGAVKFITESKDRPFFLYFPHYGVHTASQPVKLAELHDELTQWRRGVGTEMMKPNPS